MAMTTRLSWLAVISRTVFSIGDAAVQHPRFEVLPLNPARLLWR